MPNQHIVAGSAGFEYTQQRTELGPVVKYILKLTNQSRPKLCYIATARGDSPGWIAQFYDACSADTVVPSHLRLFPIPNHDHVEQYLLSQDAIWVEGGSVANLMAIWNVHGLLKILHKAWKQGIVLGGISAGALCWSAGGPTDSYGSNLRLFRNPSSFLPYSCCVHYDSEEQRRPFFQQSIDKGQLPEGYATEDGVALHFVGTTLHKAISAVEGKTAYHVRKGTDGKIVEERIEPEIVE